MNEQLNARMAEIDTKYPADPVTGRPQGWYDDMMELRMAEEVRAENAKLRAVLKEFYQWFVAMDWKDTVATAYESGEMTLDTYAEFEGAHEAVRLLVADDDQPPAF